MTGLGLGITVSIKWVGLFTIAWVGALTVLQLWILLGDTRTVTLVGVPTRYADDCSDHGLAFVVQAPDGAVFRSDCGSHHILPRNVRHSLCLPCKSWGWRWLHELGVPSDT